MKRGSRHLPAYHRGRYRIGVLGLGLAALLSLVWGQQATLASFVDGEFAGATFAADKLKPITPKIAGTQASSVQLNWDAATGNWATPAYRLSTASTSTGTDTYASYAGPATSYTHDSTNVAPTADSLPFLTMSAGATHACGIARGQAYCWGASNAGALGGATSPATSPTLVAGLAGKLVTAISAGTDRSCAIADGGLYCWGTGVGATPTLVTGISGIPTSLSSGGGQSCAVANGNVYCWTGTAATQVGGQLSSRTASSVSVGTVHACAVADAMALCWGTNTSGQLGDATYTNRDTPVFPVAGELTGRAVSQISAGDAHTCAIASGQAFCWGAGGSGRLGNGTNTTTNTAVAVNGISGTVSAVAAGFTHSCAIADGTAYCWGAASGNGGATNTTSAAALTAGSLNGRALTSISAGNGFSCAAGDTPVACWGTGAAAGSTTPADKTLNGPNCANGAVRRSDTRCSLAQATDYYYKLGYTVGSWDAPDSDPWVKATTATRPGVTPAVASRTQNSLSLSWDAAAERAQSYGQYVLQRSTSSNGSSPVTIGTTGDTTATDMGGFAVSRNFTTVSAGGSHTCGIVDGTLYCWGANGSGQLGIGSTTSQFQPTAVTGALANQIVTDVSAGGSHTCALTSEGNVYCWGANNYGQLGIGSNTTQTLPQWVASGASSISAGTNHTCGLQNGVVYCWGRNNYGQLGIGNYNNQSYPQPASSNTALTNSAVSAVSAGGSHTCAIRSGVAYCWGLGSSGQMGNTSNANRTTAVKVSAGAMANSGVTAISAGGAHTCALKAGGAYCWGSDSSGQLGNAGNLANSNTPVRAGAITAATAITAAGSQSCAIASGNAYCWGENSDGQLGTGSTTDSREPLAVSARGALNSTPVTAISAGTTHTCLIGDGNAYCFGNGTSDGRLGLGGSSSQDILTPSQVYQGVRCAADQTLLGDGSCSLSSGTTYYYRLTFTLDGKTTTVGNWVGLVTGS